MEIYKDSSETIYFRNYVSGVLTNTDGAVVATLLDSAMEEVSVLDVTTGTTGTYSALIPKSATTEETELYVRWDFDEIDKTDPYEVVTPYLDTYDIISLAPSGTSWSDAKYAEQYARNKINAATGQTFGNRTKYVSSLGKGTDVLTLNERVISCTALYENTLQVIQIGGVDEFNDFGYDIRVSDSNMAIVVDDTTDIVEYRQTGLRYRGKAFTESYDYKVYGVFGWGRVPSEISSATKELIQDYWCNDNKWRETYVKSMKNGDWTVEFDPGVYVGTGNFYVDAMIQDYVCSTMTIL